MATTSPKALHTHYGTKIVGQLSSGISNLLITGGCGFIGSFLARKLVLLYPEWRCIVIDKMDYCSSLHSLKELEHCPNFVFVKADITDTSIVHSVFKTYSIDTVVHLAAQTHVDNSFDNALKFTQVNVLGTHILLEAARSTNVSRFVHVSTDEVYGDMSLLSPNADEETILAPNNPYAATKAAAECLVRAYNCTYNLNTIITRSNNVYGPCQYPEKVIPKFICQLLNNQKCTIHGTGINVRRYVYVSDVCDALDLVLHRGQFGEIYNIGTEFELSNLDLAHLLIDKINPDSGSVVYVPDRALNDRRYAIDSRKLHSLGWTPLVEFDVGVAYTIDWYRENGNLWWGDVSDVLKVQV